MEKGRAGSGACARVKCTHCGVCLCMCLRVLFVRSSCVRTYFVSARACARCAFAPLCLCALRVRPACVRVTCVPRDEHDAAIVRVNCACASRMRMSCTHLWPDRVRVVVHALCMRGSSMRATCVPASCMRASCIREAGVRRLPVRESCVRTLCVREKDEYTRRACESHACAH